MTHQRLLLSSVFGPYGVEGPYASAGGMQMELLNNQVTREQGIHSPRAVGAFSYGLYLLAENISVPTVVLDFPEWEDFVEELKQGYTHVGIAFIIPNIHKAQRMTAYLREHYPEVKILLGGAGCVIPELDKLVSYDEICHGEGIRWLRNYFGEDSSRGIRHPAVTGRLAWYYYGNRVEETSSQIFPGVGCKNACSFCHTAHFFDRKYTSFIPDGKAMFDLCQGEEREHGISAFSVIDENFLKTPKRAVELLQEMEKKGKAYSFCIFSSAETIEQLGIDFLVRLGVNFVWLGLETKEPLFGKLKNVDLAKMVRELRANGIRVLGSSILYLEHHDEESMQEDIDWAIGMKTDLLQFMLLCVVPGTALYEQYLKAQKLIEDYPPKRMTGQGDIWFRHPNFGAPDTAATIRAAFRKSYLVNGPSTLRILETVLGGYVKAQRDLAERGRRGLVWDPEQLRYVPGKTAAQGGRDTFMEKRIESMKRMVLQYRRILPTIKVFAPNRAARRKCTEVAKLYQQTFGKPSLAKRIESAVILAVATVEVVRLALRKLTGRGELVRKTPMRRTEFHAEEAAVSPSPAAAVVSPAPAGLVLPNVVLDATTPATESTSAMSRPAADSRGATDSPG